MKTSKTLIDEMTVQRQRVIETLELDLGRRLSPNEMLLAKLMFNEGWSTAGEMVIKELKEHVEI